ncbi:MAG TPA: hypothetical protein VFH61_11600 [Thermoleophilia bacterium]|nr:hypothetical protein [Thermoleophilia bacterium]
MNEGTYIMPVAAQGYPEGYELVNVTLKQARDLKCNRCGGCCSGLREHVRKDDETGLPLHTWESPESAAGPGSQTADPDRYNDRTPDGSRLLLPVITNDEGELLIGETYDIDLDGRPHTSFHCSQLLDHPDGADGAETGCGLYAEPVEVRPYNCGAFPVFGLEVDDSIIEHGAYVPPLGNLPECEWYGLRIVGPWKER